MQIFHKKQHNIWSATFVNKGRLRSHIITRASKKRLIAYAKNHNIYYQINEI